MGQHAHTAATKLVKVLVPHKRPLVNILELLPDISIGVVEAVTRTRIAGFANPDATKGMHASLGV